ncbi:MAG: hypothetical protein LBJ36_04325 [Synergistaceae bacterium]|jgi:GGDEF domain-containing protein|nr:hypothetical protein [Synergistaceae bacterium]
MSDDDFLKEPGIRVSTQWLFLPPITALCTVVVAGLFSSDSRVPVDDAIWGLLGLFFIILTVLYGIFIRRNFTKGFFPVQLIAQGILLCPLSLKLGARMFQWVGVILAICGAVVLAVLYYRFRPVSSGYTYVPEFSPYFTFLPLPCAITDAEGNVIAVTEVMLQLTQKKREAVEGEKISSILPLDQETIDLAGRSWKILQTPIKRPFAETEETNYYFQLEEMRDVAITLPSYVSEEAIFIDPATSLYTRSYAERRVNEELYRVRRYQRKGAAVLIRMIFQGNTPLPKENEIFNAYCRYLRSNTRMSDIACLVGPRDLLLVMPEVSLEQAEMAIGRLVDFVPHVQEELKGFDGAAEIQEEILFFDSSSEDLNFDLVLNKLDEALGV